MKKDYGFFRSELKSKNVARYKVVGITTEIILDPDIFAKNDDVAIFLQSVYGLSFKDYILKSRTSVVSRVAKELCTADAKTLENVRKKLLLFVNALLETDMKTVSVKKSKSKNSNSVDFGKWMNGITSEK